MAKKGGATRKSAKGKNNTLSKNRGGEQQNATGSQDSSAQGKSKGNGGAQASLAPDSAMLREATGAGGGTQASVTSTPLDSAILGEEGANRKRKTMEDVASMGGKGWDIRFGALETMAVYTGEKGSPYCFVQLQDDVLFGDTDEEALVLVEWIEADSDGVLRLSEDRDSVAIGSLICSVTVEIIERMDGGFDIPTGVHEKVKAALERQLSDDYCDLTGEDDDGPDYAARMKKSFKKVKMEKVEKMEDMEVEDGDDDGGNPDKPVKRSKKGGRGGKKKASAQKAPTKGRGKLKLTPRPTVALREDSWEVKTGKVNAFNGDTHRASREVIRAYRSGDKAALRKVLKNTNDVADPFCEQSCDVDMSVFDYALLAEDKDTLEVLSEEAGKNENRCSFPVCSLVQLSSGRHTSSYADYNRHQVGASRGGQEGNNAFTADMNGSNYGGKGGGRLTSERLQDLLVTHDPLSESFLEYVAAKCLSDSLFGGWEFNFHRQVTLGNRSIAHKALKEMENRGAGLNNLHVEVLGSGGTLESFRSVSVVKNSGSMCGWTRFCPVHCAASNPNPTYLQQLLEVSPTAVDTLDSDEASVLHYAAVGEAAVGETSETLAWLLAGPGQALNRNAKLRKGDKSTPLMWAARAARGGNVRALCEGQTEAAVFTVKNAAGETALHVAARSGRAGRLDTARALIKCGSPPDVRGDARLLNKQTASMICAERGDLELLEVLVEGGASLAATDKLGRTLLMFAAKNGHLRLMSYLVREGVNLEAEDTSGNTAIHYAAAYGWVGALEFLLEVGAPADPRNSWATTPLVLALKKGRFACAITLLRLGSQVDLNVVDKTGRSLLSSLVGSYMSQLDRSQTEIPPLPWALTQMLDRPELDTTLVDSNGATVLHYIASASLGSSGAQASALALVEKLLPRGVDPLVADKEGRVAAVLALQHDTPQLALCKLLLGHASHAAVKRCEGGGNMLHLLMSKLGRELGRVPSQQSNYDEDNSDEDEDEDEDDSGDEDEDMEVDGEVGVEGEGGQDKGEDKGEGGQDYKLFLEVFDLLNLNLEWSAQVDNNGMTPLLLAVDAARTHWSAASGVFLEKLVERLPQRVGDTRQPVADCRKEKEGGEKERGEGGGQKAEWTLAEVFKGSGSMSLLHALARVPQIKWVKTMYSRVLRGLTNASTLLNLKGHDGLDVTGHVLTTFLGSPVETVVSLVKLLRDHGANIDSVSHRVFSSVVELESVASGEESVGVDVPMEGAEGAQSLVETVRLREQQRVVAELASARQDGKPPPRALVPLFYSRTSWLLHSQVSPELLEGLITKCGLQPGLVDLEANHALLIATGLKLRKHVKVLVPHCDVNAVNTGGESSVTLGRGDKEMIQLLLGGENADINHISPLYGTLLHAAAGAGDSKLVEFLLDSSSKVDIRDRNGRTALHLAVAQAAVSTREEVKPVEEQLLAGGADVNATDQYGRTPLHYAFVAPACDMRCDFPPSDTRDPIDLLTTLSEVQGVRLDIADEDERTPLHMAAAVGASICVLYLTERCPPKQLEGCDSDGNTPLALSLLGRRAHTTLLLISKGGELDVRVAMVTRAREKNGKVKVVSQTHGSTLYVALAASSAHTTWWGQSGGGNVEFRSVARYMLSAGRLPMDTVLSALFRCGNFQLALKQIQLCSNVATLRSPSARDGMTSLHRLAQVPSFAASPEFAPVLADALIDRGVSSSTTCAKGWSVIHVAAYHGHEGLLRHFFNAHNVGGGLVLQADADGGTALQSMFAGKKASRGVLCTLADAAGGEAGTFVNGGVRGKRSRRADEAKWAKLADVESSLLVTPPEKRHALPDVIHQLETEAKRPTPATTSANDDDDAYTVPSTAVIEAIRLKDVGLLKVLRYYGGDAEKRDGDGRTSLHHAVMSGDARLVSALLGWGGVSLNAVDGAGRSALTYAVLGVLDGVSGLVMELLLSHGADPLAGNALLLAIQHNKQRIALSMIRCVCAPMVAAVSGEQPEPPAKRGERVWVRSGGVCSTWRLATVVTVRPDNQLDVVAGEVTDMAAADVVGVDGRVRPEWVRRLEHESDGIKRIVEVLHPLVKDHRTKPEDARRALIKSYKGWETGLAEHLMDNPKCVPYVSPLSVGDVVGQLVVGPNAGTLLHVGTVTTAHANGQYDVQLFGGRTLERASRGSLRPLRKPLHMATTAGGVTTLDSKLIHACVSPVSFGGYAGSLPLLRALVEAGASVSVPNAEGETPLDRAAPGSDVQAYLREVTGCEGGGRGLPPPPTLPSLGGLDFDSDAEGALETLHNAGADITEPVIPSVNRLCEVDSVGVYVGSDRNSEGSYFDVALTKVDVEHGRYGKYVFYKMQVVHDPVQKVYILFTNWGRIGECGKFQQTPFRSREECEAEFAKVFRSKTGNVWSERHQFERQPGKYTLVHRATRTVKHPERLLQGVAEADALPCRLPSEVASMLRFLLDPTALNAAVSECRYNQDQLPFGRLSLSTLQAAEEKLRAIKTVLKREQDTTKEGVTALRTLLEEVARLSSEFYELLPMGDKIVAPFRQETDPRFGEAVEMIRLLRDLTVTKQILLGALHRQTSHNPLDYAYGALGVHMAPLAESDDRRCLQRSIDVSCGDDFVVNEIFELDTGHQLPELPNKRLLFHGSKNTNILGILKNGLRIAPPEAPTTGWMFGKGVYFADQFAKAADYATGFNHSTGKRQQPRAYVFVAEVALGESHPACEAEYMEKPREGTHSTHGVGSEAPDSGKDVVLGTSGSLVHLGEVTQTTQVSSPGSWMMGSYSELPKNVCDEIEKVRRDTTTTFPASLVVDSYSQKHLVTLSHGPESTQATMRQLSEEELGQDREGGVEETKDEDDVRLESTTSSYPVDTIQFQKEGRRRHYHFGSHSRKRFNEFIVYDTSQIRLKYLIELTSRRWVKQQHGKKKA